MANPLQNFREKYPQYGDIGDTELGDMLATKYPEAYGDLAAVSPTEASPGEDTEAQPVEPGFIESVKSDFGRRTEELKGMVERQEHPILEAPKTLAVSAAESVGFLGDVAAEGISRAYKKIVPEETQGEVKEAFNRIGQTEVGKIGIEAFKKGFEEFSKFEKWNPDAALAVKSMFNIFGGSVVTNKAIVPTVKAAKGSVKLAGMSAVEAKNIVGDVTSMLKKEIDPTDITTTSKIVKSGYTKGVGLKGKHAKADKHIDKIIDDANLAVRTIIENKNNIKISDSSGRFIDGVPTNLRQFGRAIGETKGIIFKQYDDIARKAGQEGAKVDIDGIASELMSLSRDKGMTRDIREYAKKQYDELVADGILTTTEAQTRVKILNNKLGTILDYQSSPHRVVDSLIRNNLRKGLNDVIENLDGSGVYSELKRKYGALRSIEEDVAKKAMQVANKQEKGLIDFSDIFTHSELASGLATMDPARIVKGTVGIGLKSRYKFLNNPNNAIKSMFKNADTIMAGESYKPKSRLLKNVNRKTKPTARTNEHDVPTYLRQGKTLTKFKDNVETGVYRYLPTVEYIKSTTPKIKTTLRQAGEKIDVKNKQRALKESEEYAIEKAVDLAFKRQKTLRDRKGPPLKRVTETEYVKSSLPKIETTLRPAELKQIIKTKVAERIADEVAINEKRVSMAIRKQVEAKGNTGPPLIRRGFEGGKSKRPMSVEERLKNIAP